MSDTPPTPQKQIRVLTEDSQKKQTGMNDHAQGRWATSDD